MLPAQVAGAALKECHSSCAYQPLTSCTGRECQLSASLALHNLGLGAATPGGLLGALLPPGAAGALTRLELQNTEGLPPAALAGCSRLTELQSLQLCAGTTGLPGLADALLAAAPRLTELHLSTHAWFGGAPLPDVPAAVRALPCLRRLVLHGYKFAGMSPGPFLEQLLELDLSTSRMPLSPALAAATQLTRLAIPFIDPSSWPPQAAAGEALPMDDLDHSVLAMPRLRELEWLSHPYPSLGGARAGSA